MMMEYLNKKVLEVNVAMLLILLMGFSATVEAAGGLSQSPSYNTSQFLGNGGDAITPPGMRRRRYQIIGNYPEAYFERHRGDHIIPESRRNYRRFKIPEALDDGGDHIIPESRRHRTFRIPEAHSSAKKKDCCDRCGVEILYSIRYRCKDVWESSCPSSCPASYCNCDESHPPQCQCMLVDPDKCPIPTCS